MDYGNINSVTIEINMEQWNQASGGKRRVMLNKWFWPRVYPNGYRWTPLIVVQPLKAVK